MTKKVLGIVFSLIFIAAFAFVLAWGIINFNKVKEGMSGTGLYTQEDLNKAHEDGYNSALKDKDEYDGIINDYRDKITELNDNISQLNTQVNNLTSSNSDYLKRIDLLLNEKSQVEDEKERLLIEKDEILNNSNKLNDDIKNLNNQVTMLNDTISKNENTILYLNGQINSLSEQIESLTNSGNSYSEIIDDLNVKLEKLTKERDNLIIENTTYSNTITSLNNQILNLRTLNTQLEQTSALQQQTISNLNLQISNLNQQISDMSMLGQTNNSTISALNTKIKELQESIKYYENYIAQLETGNQVVATFEYDGTVYNIQIVNSGSKLNVISPESTEYKIFNGWKVDGVFIDLDTFIITSNTKIVADVSYKNDVVFKVDNNIYNSQIVDLNGLASIPETPTKEGYVFAGWSLDGIATINVLQNKITCPTTYFAIFTKLYNVTFKYEDNILSTQTIENGKYATEIRTPNIDYKIFNGWKLNGSIVDLSTYKITSDITLIADITYRYDVKFKVEGKDYNAQIVTKNNYTALPENPTKAGYDFVGWTLNDEIVNVATYAIEENTIFEAKFEKLYNVTFVYEDNVISEQIVRNGSYANSVSVDSTNYKLFNGWKVNDSSVNLSTYKITQDTVFVANIIYKFDVHFMVDDEIYNAQIIAENTNATAPLSPEKENYKFIGWSLDKETIVNLLDVSIIENTTFYAMFEYQIYTVTFNVDGEIHDSQNVNSGFTATMPKTPNKLNYEFIGWSIDGVNTIDIETYEITTEISFIALFEEYNWNGTYKCRYMESQYSGASTHYIYHDIYIYVKDGIPYLATCEGKEVNIVYSEEEGGYAMEAVICVRAKFLVEFSTYENGRLNLKHIDHYTIGYSSATKVSSEVSP